MARILLVDDEPQLLEAMEQALTDASHDVTAVSDGCFVIDGSTGVDFDLVVTDMVMPGADGVETLTYLRRCNPQMGLIAISGGGHIPPWFHLRLASKSGAMVTLEKPFELCRLVDAVEGLLVRLQRDDGRDPG